MPELPEVETMRRGILPVVGGVVTKIVKVKCSRKPISVEPRIDRFNRQVAGRQIVAVERLGKRVALRLDSNDRIMIEPRMTGLVLIADPPTREHLRIEIVLADAAVSKLWYWDRRGLGSVYLWTDAQFQQKCIDGTLGPDALEVSMDDFLLRFKKGLRPIKVALLDQSIVAGIGNLYASEILHMAKVHPETSVAAISKIKWRSIYNAMRTILELAIQYEGSTLADGTYRNSLNQSGSYQNQHRVYGQAESRCPSCQKAKICRIVQAQRSTFFCPQCQLKPAREIAE